MYLIWSAPPCPAAPPQPECCPVTPAPTAWPDSGETRLGTRHTSRSTRPSGTNPCPASSGSSPSPPASCRPCSDSSGDTDNCSDSSGDTDYLGKSSGATENFWDISGAAEDCFFFLIIALIDRRNFWTVCSTSNDS